VSAHIKVAVDGKVRMNGDLGDWTTEPPFITEQKLAVAAKRDDPWSVPILMMFARSATNGRSVSIEVTTEDNGSYSMDVEYA
jgi:hypothetical protein